MKLNYNAVISYTPAALHCSIAASYGWLDEDTESARDRQAEICSKVANERDNCRDNKS